MTPVLIYTDTNRIAKEIDFLDDSIAPLQAVYNALASQNIPFTLTDISNLVGWTVNRNVPSNFVQDFVINRLLDAAAPYVLNGVPLTRDSVRNMLVVPDVSALITSLNAFIGLYGRYSGLAIRIDLVSLSAGVISKVENADDTITTAYTYYTKTDASATLANSLQAVCDALNTHDASYNNSIVRFLVNNNVPSIQYNTSIQGVAVVGSTFYPSLAYIQNFERTVSLNDI